MLLSFILTEEEEEYSSFMYQYSNTINNIRRWYYSSVKRQIDVALTFLKLFETTLTQLQLCNTCENENVIQNRNHILTFICKNALFCEKLYTNICLVYRYIIISFSIILYFNYILKKYFIDDLIFIRS